MVRELPKRLTVNVGALEVTAAVAVRRRAAGSAEKRGFGVWLIRIAAAFAFLWSVFRVVYQSVALDEADTYLWFVAGQEGVWYGFPNNHILNSVLIWISTHLFGLSPLTIRIPALLGGALYIAIAYFLCRAITERPALQFATFICLVYNPFILDFFAAARGYSLANAFLLAAVATPLWHARGGCRSAAASGAIASAAIGFSFCSNFSYAFVDVAALLAITVWAIRERGRTPALRIVAWCVLPAATISALLGGYAITHYPRTELWYGAKSVGEMLRSLADACLYQLWEPLAQSEAIREVGPILLVLLGLLCVGRLITGAFDRVFWRDVKGQLIAGLTGVLALTFAAHYLMFRVFRLPLPLSRTAIYFLPLCTLLVAVAAASSGQSRLSRRLGHALVAALVGLSAHYVASLRYTYFKEYIQSAELKQVYRIVERLNREYGVRDFETAGAYASSLNFYRVAAKNHNLPTFIAPPGMLSPGKPVYVLHADYHRSLIDQSKLTILYRGPVSRVAVAVPPDSPVPPTPIEP